MDVHKLLFDGIAYGYAIGGTNGGVIPNIDTLFTVDGSSVSGASGALALNRGARGFVDSGKGIQDAPKTGLVMENAFLFSRNATFSNAGAYGAYLYAGSDLNGDTIDLTYATDDGALITRTSRVELQGADVSNAGVNGLLATQASLVSAGEIIANDCINGAGVRGRGAAIVSCNSVSAQRCKDGLYADRGSIFSIDDDTTSSNFTGCTRYAIFARKKSKVTGQNVICGDGRIFGELGADMVLPGVSVSNILNGGHAVLSSTGANINVDNGIIGTTATASRAIKTDGGTVSANGSTVTGTQGQVVSSGNGGEIRLSQATVNVTSGAALYLDGGDIIATKLTINAVDQLVLDSLNGGRMECGSLTLNWSGTPPATAFRVKDGTIMNVSGTTEGANIAVNTVTSDGMVIQ
jgi:hypothetical protein